MYVYVRVRERERVCTIKKRVSEGMIMAPSATNAANYSLSFSLSLSLFLFTTRVSFRTSACHARLPLLLPRRSSPPS